MGLPLTCREQPLALPRAWQPVGSRHVQTLLTVPQRPSVDAAFTHDLGAQCVGNFCSRPSLVQFARSASCRGRRAPVTRAVSSSATADVRENRTELGNEPLGLKPLPKHLVAENLADDPTLGNPLQRHKRMGTDWIGVIMDYEGGLVEDTTRLHTEAWLRLAEEEVKPRPVTHVLKRAALMKAEQAISEVLCWGREPVYVRRLAQRKEEIYKELLGDWRPAEIAGARDLLDTLKTHEVPVAVCSLRNSVHDDLKRLGLESYVNAVVAPEDVQRCQPDPEAYMYAAQLIKRPTARCIVIGASIQSFEAAHDCGMQCVAVAGQQPLYEFTAADLVMKQLDEVSFVNFKQLFTLEEGTEPQVEFEEEVETVLWS